MCVLIHPGSTVVLSINGVGLLIELTYLSIFLSYANGNKQMVENMTYFLAELGIINYATVMYCPSMITTSTIYRARCTLKKASFWNETLALHTGFSEPQLMECAKEFVRFHSGTTENKMKAIYKKYSNAERGAVSLLPLAKTVLTVAVVPHS